MTHHQQLQISASHHLAPAGIAGVSQLATSELMTKRPLNIYHIMGFFRRQWLVIVLPVLLGLILAAVYLYTTPPRYTATSVLMLDSTRRQPFQVQSLGSEASVDDPFIESQLEVLRSKAVAMSVINTLDLTNDPEFTGGAPSLFSKLTAAAPKFLTWFKQEPQAPPSPQDIAQHALDYFQNNLTISRLGRSYVVEVSFLSLDGGKASRIANAVGEAYIQDQLQAKFSLTKQSATWLKERVDELRQKAESADRAALEFRRMNNLTDAGGKLISEQQISEINTQLISAKGQTAEAKARLDRIVEISTRGVDDAAMGDSMQNPVLNRLQQQYIDTAKREADFISRYGEDHVAVANLRKERQQIQDVSKAELNRLAESYKSNYEIARSREQALQTSLDRLMRELADTRLAQVALRQLESSASAYRTMHDNLLQRFVEATQQQSFSTTGTRLITEAMAAEKTHPRTSIVLALACLLGVSIGSAVALTREGLGQSFHTPQQVEQALGVECLGVIPTVTSPKGPVPPYDSSQALNAQAVKADIGVARQAVLAPFSRFSETIRAIKVAADVQMGMRGAKVIGLTSTLSGEGKSTVASNLAQLIAHSGRSALLIDADFRSLNLTQRIAPAAERGTLDVLDGTAKLSSTIWRDPVTGLDFLPTVLKEPKAHISEIVSSNQMADLLAYAREHYDYIILDFPPIAPVVDAKAAANHVDAFVFVVEWGQTSYEAVLEALGAAGAVHDRILGVVLNKADPAKLKKFETYKGDAYHSYFKS